MTTSRSVRSPTSSVRRWEAGGAIGGERCVVSLGDAQGQHVTAARPRPAGARVAERPRGAAPARLGRDPHRVQDGGARLGRIAADERQPEPAAGGVDRHERPRVAPVVGVGRPSLPPRRRPPDLACVRRAERVRIRGECGEPDRPQLSRLVPAHGPDVEGVFVLRQRIVARVVVTGLSGRVAGGRRRRPRSRPGACRRRPRRRCPRRGRAAGA
jgi:hypothetical protein